MASESPTRMMSTPASSAMRAPGASYAVTITSGAEPDATFRARTAGAVRPIAFLLPSSARVAAGGGQPDRRSARHLPRRLLVLPRPHRPWHVEGTEPHQRRQSRGVLPTLEWPHAGRPEGTHRPRPAPVLGAHDSRPRRRGGAPRRRV